MTMDRRRIVLAALGAAGLLCACATDDVPETPPPPAPGKGDGAWAEEVVLGAPVLLLVGAEAPTLAWSGDPRFDGVLVTVGDAPVGVWLAVAGGDWTWQGWQVARTRSYDVEPGQPAYLALTAQGEPAEVTVALAGPSFDGERARPNRYTFGFGGDLDADGRVDKRDYQLLQAARMGLSPMYPEYDVDRNGKVGPSDASFLLGVIDGQRPTLLGADLIESNPATGEPAWLELFGQNLGPVGKLAVGDFVRPLELWSDEERGGQLGRVELSDADVDALALRHRKSLTVTTDTGTTLSVPLLSRPTVLGIERDGGGFLLADEAPPAPGQRPAAQPGQNCCYVKRVVFRARANGMNLRAYAVDDEGRQATTTKKDGNGDIESITVGTDIKGPAGGKPNTLNGPFREAHFRIVDKDGATLAEILIDCTTMKGTVISEAQPPAPPGATVPRPRILVDIIDIEIEWKPCQQAAPQGTATGGRVTPWDDKDWPDVAPPGGPAPGTTHKGSGALSQFALDPATLTNVGCKKACWVQAVETRIDILPAGQTKWQNQIDDAVHNDNLNADAKPLFPNTPWAMPNGYPWYCYGAQNLDPQTGYLVAGDGPHIFHAYTYKDANGREVGLQNGDRLRRRSSFYTFLMCVDPEMDTPLDSWSWTITTIYVAGIGATTQVLGPFRETPTADNPRKRAAMDREKLKKHIKKKAARQAKK
jgi:hypothetical protein